MTTPTPAGTGQPGPEDAPGRNHPDQAQGPRTNRSARRTFTTEFKRSIVQEYDAAPNGTKGAILRRERLYDSHIQEWRAASRAGSLEKKPTATRGRPKATTKQSEIARLAAERAAERAAHERTLAQLAFSDAALDVLGKGVAFLEALSSKNAPSTAPTTKPGKPGPSTN